MITGLIACETSPPILPDFPCPERYFEEPIPRELVQQIPEEAKLIIIRNYEGYRANIELLETISCEQP